MTNHLEISGSALAFAPHPDGVTRRPDDSNGGSLPRLWAFLGYPPTTAMGGGIILRNLLDEYPGNRLTIVSNANVMDTLAARENGGGLLPVPHVGIRPWTSRVPGLRRALRTASAARALSIAGSLARRMTADSVILAVPWSGELGSELYVAAYLVHRRTGTPLVIYELDEWRASLGRASGLAVRLLERFFHRRIVRAAQAVWAISPPLAEQFHTRFGVEAGILSNCVDVARYSQGRRGERAGRDVLRILYTGAVYGAQAGAIRNVLQAIAADTDGPVSLTIYTGQTREDLAAQGVDGPALDVRPALPLAAMPGLLGTADVLLLPFSFDDDQRAVVSTSLPSKTADYLASGVPVLVHAPAYSSVAALARAEGWGEVVDDPSPQSLIAALRRLAGDMSYRRQLVGNALRIAAARHDLARSRAEFQESLRRAANPHPPVRGV